MARNSLSCADVLLRNSLAAFAVSFVKVRLGVDTVVVQAMFDLFIPVAYPLCKAPKPAKFN